MIPRFLRTMSHIALFLFVPTTVFAGAVSFPLLVMEDDARSAARASVGIGGEFDATNLYASPAALAHLSGREAGFHFLKHVSGMKVMSAQYATNEYAGLALALGFRRLGYGDLDGRDLEGQSTGSFDAGENLIQLSGARVLTQWQGGEVSTGLRVGFFNATLEDARASALLIGAGVDWRRGGLSLGMQARNFGKVLKDYDQASAQLPQHLEFGMVHRLAHLPLSWSLSYVTISGRDAEIRGGGEFLLGRRWHLGFGYQFGLGDERLVDVSGEGTRGLSAGVGGPLPGGFSFHWSWASLGELGAQNRFSLAMQF